ncbi:hypothetical protein MAM1_0007c00874 [Mucor ambiguus]|uniref:Uncharacterized protein n=1 Tax=Mucor ambiguus TaxID=91626 RepID=A0A0C9M0B4_9FUNG|nr:hypothetical protein MAM1_0007c00874 [Mucor ambiguus]
MMQLHNSTPVSSINNIDKCLTDNDGVYRIRLTELEIDMIHSSLKHTIVFYLLQYLRNLTALSFNSIRATNRDIPIISHTQLKTFHIGYFDGTGALNSTNRVFKVDLPACPLMEHFNTRLNFDPAYIQARMVFELEGSF